MSKTHTYDLPVPLPVYQCPLCGKDNDCQPAKSGTFGEGCWCMTQTISPESLERIPVSLKGKACLCPACAGLTENDK